MADITHVIGSTGTVKKLHDLGDGSYADVVYVGGSSGDGLTVALQKIVDAATVAAAATTVIAGKLLTGCSEAIIVVSCDKAFTIEYGLHATAVQTNYNAVYWLDSYKVTGNAAVTAPGRVMLAVDLSGHLAIHPKLTNNDGAASATVSIWVGGRG